MPSTVVLASRYGLPLNASPEFVRGYLDVMRWDEQPRDALGRFARTRGESGRFARIAAKAEQSGVAKGKSTRSEDRLSVTKELIQGSKDPQGAYEALTEVPNRYLRQWRDEALGDVEALEEDPDMIDEETGTIEEAMESAHYYEDLLEARSWLKRNGGTISDDEKDDLLSWMYENKLDSPFAAGYRSIMRMDSVRPSCMECVEKHLGAALVLMGEAEAGYPEHKLLAIGHLHEAAEESADMRPELSALLRDIRKRYQQGEAIEFETILEALDQHGVWRFDQRGQGVACGKGWIPRSKKCSSDKAKQTSKEAKAKTVEKSKARAELKRAVKEGKGQKAYVKPKPESDKPAKKPRFQEFKKPPSIDSIARNLGGYAYAPQDELAKVPDNDLIKEWKYSSLANASIRYPKIFPQTYKSNANYQRVGQMGGQNYRSRLAVELGRRDILDVADNSFSINLEAMQKQRTDSFLQGYLEVMSWRSDQDTPTQGQKCGDSHISQAYVCRVNNPGDNLAKVDVKKVLADPSYDRYEQDTERWEATKEGPEPDEADYPYTPTDDTKAFLSELMQLDEPEEVLELATEASPASVKKDLTKTQNALRLAEQYAAFGDDPYAAKEVLRSAIESGDLSQVESFPKAKDLAQQLKGIDPGDFDEVMELFEYSAKDLAGYDDARDDLKQIAANPDARKAFNKYTKWDPEAELDSASDGYSREELERREQTLLAASHPDLRKKLKTMQTIGTEESNGERPYNWIMDQLWKAQEAKNARSDAFLQGYLEVMSWRFDRKGEGVACGRGWISRRKKCGRDKARTTSPEAKARTVEKQKVRQQLRGQVKAAKGQKPYVKLKPEPDTPQGMPHKNPKTPQEFIENGRAVAGAFLANAKKLDSDIASQQQEVAEAEKRVIRQRQEAWSTNIRKVADEIADNPDYQREQDRLQQARDLQDTIEQRYSEGSLSKKEFDSLSDTYRGMRSESAQVLSDMRKAKLDELIQNDPDLKFFSESLARKQQKLATLAAPAAELKQQLISTSAMTRADAEARAKKVKKPPKAKDPGLAVQIADFNQLTNGVPTTLNRITITKQRAHATRDGLARYYGPGQDRRALWHEMAHHLEFADPSIAKVAEDWVKSRATGPQESLRKLTGNNRYDRSEKAYPDDFADPYVGKVYSDGTTEVLSMGLEAFSSPERMIQLAAKDPDHFALVLGLMRRPQ